MRNAISKRVTAFAVGSLCVIAGVSLNTSANSDPIRDSDVGNPAFTQAQNGQWKEAAASAIREYGSNPTSPITQFNMGELYRRSNDQAKANIYYSQAAASGQNTVPTAFLDQHPAGTTIGQAACQELSRAGARDPNCPI